MNYVFYFDIYYTADNRKEGGRLSTFIIARCVLNAREKLNSILEEYHKEFDVNIYKVKLRGCDLL